MKTLIPLSCLAIISGCNLKSDEKAAEKPNILIIYADDVGIGDLSCYGSKLIQTPSLDAIAENGIRFTNGYATAAMCTPSRYSLLTGIYAFRLPGSGILSAEDPMCIEPESYTLPKMLRNNGYRTAVVGKWHLGLGDTFGGLDWNGDIKPGPLEIGFDESFLLPVTTDRVPTVYLEGHRVYNLEPGDSLFVRYPDEAFHLFQEQQYGKYGKVDTKPLVGNLPTGLTHPQLTRYTADTQHSGTIVNGVSRIGHMAGGKSAWWDDEKMTDLFAEKAKAFITKEKEKPFFLYLAMQQNHVPRIPNPRFAGTSGCGLRGDHVVELDWIVGEMIKALKDNGLYDNTIIIFSSDNGPVLYDGYNDGALETVGTHDPSAGFRGGKYVAFEASTRVPTLLQWPAKVKGGVISDALVSQVDFLASFAALVSDTIPENIQIDSRNMLPSLLGTDSVGRQYVVQQTSDGLGLRSGKWKYIEPNLRSAWGYNRHNMGEPNAMHVDALGENEYLFNLDADPQETKNLADEYPEILSEMRQALIKIKNEFTISK